MPDEFRVPVLVGVGQPRADRARATAGAREPLALTVEAQPPAAVLMGAPVAKALS